MVPVVSLVACAAAILCAWPIAARDIQSDQWVATDALGRQLPGYDDCKKPHDAPPQSRHVGIFYFVWHGQHGTEGPFDITRILSENPTSPAWGPVGAFHHWSEPEMGYYLAGDAYVVRKHAQMLSDAGVDTLILDATNGPTYKEVYLKICEVFSVMRAQGERTPQIAFLANKNSVVALYDEFYAQNLYPDLWFRWKGKPLLLVGQDPAAHGVTDWAAFPAHIREFFAGRSSWAWDMPEWYGDGRDAWPWIAHTPQVYGWHEDPKKAEEVSVAVAQHPVTNIGRSHRAGTQPKTNRYDMTSTAGEGIYFEEQWQRVFELDPEFVFVTGWNEWVAQRFTVSETTPSGSMRLAGRPLTSGESFFVDIYNWEYSRDAEPMKGGFTDNYYYQLVANIRKYKGVRPPHPASSATTITIDGPFSQWEEVQPAYFDHIFDTLPRNEPGWGSAGPYVNTTGRNDFDVLKVAHDDTHLYFYAQTRDDITPWTDPHWMLLYIDTDQDHTSGWHGYDYLVNASVTDERTTTVMKWTRTRRWKKVADIAYRAEGNRLMLALPRAVLDLGEGRSSFDFHWADNIQQLDEITEFFVSGDSAPDRRFNFRYTAQADIR